MNLDGGPALVYESSGEIVAIDPAGTVIGRGAECALHIPDATVSKQHARVVREGSAFVVIDLGSTNGTFVNGVQVRSKVLADGDHIRFGTVSFRFRAMPSVVLEPRAPDRRLTRALESLRKLSSDALALESERALIRAVTDFLLEFLTADRVFVAFAREGRDDLDLAMIRTRPSLDPKRAVAPVPHSPMQRAMKTRRTFCPATEPQDYAATSASMRAASLGSIIVVPLIARSRVLGAVEVERLDGTWGPFDEVDVLVGELASNLLAGSLESARLYRASPQAPGAPAAANGANGATGPTQTQSAIPTPKGLDNGSTAHGPAATDTPIADASPVPAAIAAAAAAVAAVAPAGVVAVNGSSGAAIPASNGIGNKDGIEGTVKLPPRVPRLPKESS